MIGVSADRRWEVNGRLSLLTMGSNSPALRPHFNGGLAALHRTSCFAASVALLAPGSCRPASHKFAVDLSLPWVLLLSGALRQWRERAESPGP
jgi:hypothetical protein